LRDGQPARAAAVADEERRAFDGLQLLTAKPVLYVCNVGEADAAAGNAFTRQVAERAAAEGAEAVVISAQIEAEMIELPEDERAAFLDSLGLHETGLARVITAGYRLLHLITFFTAGPKETRAWTVPKGTKAPQAAGVIHSDFEKGFIRAETIAHDDFIALGGEQGAKDAGRMRSEGRDYTVADGDILLFRFNV
jgi:GTP-binding protein YchF